MKRTFAALLALCVLALAGCAKQNTEPDAMPAEPPAQNQTVAAEPEPESEPESEPEPFDGFTELACGELVVPIPHEYAELLVINTALEPWNEHWTPLVSLSELASVEAGQLEHPDEDWGEGWLCTLVRLDRIGFEDWAAGEHTGTLLFARRGEDAYYLMSQPTDVRFYRPEGTQQAEQETEQEQWLRLSEWADGLPDAILDRNSLTAYDASDLFDVDYTYGGEHVEYSFSIPTLPMDRVILSLSQPAKQGEGGVWCVERIQEIYSDYNFTDMHLVFPAALGIDETATDYYARLQSECDAGEHPELLTPRGAVLSYARNDAVKWLFGEDVSATDFELVESLG